MGRLSASRHSSARRNTAARPRAARTRVARFESLEARTVMTALPYGAMNDDTGEYMLGDVRVTVVLLESDSALGPHDNGTITYPGELPITYTPENWTPAAIAAVKSNVQAGIEWWKQSLDAMPNVRDGLLNFSFDWTYADNPVRTGYEPIARKSNDFSQWIYDFLNVTGFTTNAPNFSGDIRAFNNFQRQQTNADWAFTIFVVNNANDADKMFASGGSFDQAFAFAGGRFMVVPASRPASSFAHEAGHMFWALDEYSGASTYAARRGYYNTANSNAIDNPEQGFAQQPSIMTNGSLMAAAFNTNTTSQSSQEIIGWRDTDSDGIFDVLDVPFALTGTGRYDAANQRYLFTGASNVRTMPNQNSAGLQNDITINRIRQVEYSIDGGPWTIYQTFADRTYKTNLELSLPLVPGEHTIKIRTVDTRTGVMSPEFVGTTTVPTSTDQSGVSGFVFFDSDGDGTWDNNESPLVDWAVEIVDEFGGPVLLQQNIEPNDYLEGAVLNSAHPSATLTAIGGDAATSQVTARSSTRFPSAGRVFWGSSISDGGGPIETWTTSSRRLRIDPTAPTTTVSIRALSSGATSFGRLEAYDAAGNLLERYTTAALTSGKSEMMTIVRPTADIAYVIARAHAGTEVVLDSLTVGPNSSATTNFLGAYSLRSLDTGTYRITVTPPSGHVVTTPASGMYTINFVAGQVVGDQNFGLRLHTNIWHNLARAENVTGEASGLVNLLDVVALINWLSVSGGNPHLPPAGNTAAVGYIDVDNNGICNLLDLLAVVNYLTRNAAASGGGGEGEVGGGSGEVGSGARGSGGGPGGEGEEFSAALAPSATAAEYYARSPLHFLEIPGTDLPCCCSSCLPAHGFEPATVASFAVLEATTVAEGDTLPPFLSDEHHHEHGAEESSSFESSEATDPLFGLSPRKRLDRESEAASVVAQSKYPPRRARMEQAIDELADEAAQLLTKSAPSRHHG
jgi:hypothetical protein